MIRMITYSLFGLASMGAALFFWQGVYNPALREGDIIFLTLKEATFEVVVVRTEESRARGLSGRTELQKNQGMLFVFEESKPWGFWMKGMFIPLDIVWLDDNLEVIDIERKVMPDSYPHVFYPDQPGRYVLEVGGGETEEYHIEVGDRARFVR